MKTGLYERHCVLGAKMVDFAGWEMPVLYKGIIQEHMAVRNDVGVFDTSHMGRILINGPDAEKFLDFLSTNKIAGKKDLTATYTVWCHENGGCIDDLIVYKQSSDNFFVVVNASNREKDLDHLRRYSSNFDVMIEERFDDGILAIQGPKAKALVAKIFDESNILKPMRFLPLEYKGTEIILSNTGYTGSGGFEIYTPTSAIVELWDRFLILGQEYAIRPVGLGARDTLRLEMGFALYGHELSDEIAPTETVSAWTVKWDKENFLGKQALEVLENSAKKRSQYGVILADRGIAREGYKVYKDDIQIGYVTSGTMSPSLNQAIAIVLVEGKLHEGDNVDVQIRNKRSLAKVINLPFYQRVRT